MINLIKKIYLFIYLFICNTYNIFLKNIFLYFRPIEVKLVFDSDTNMFENYDSTKTYSSNYLFLYKINRIERKSYHFYNYGYYYYVSQKNIFNSTITKLTNSELELAESPDVIENIKITYQNNEEYNITDKMAFISSILNYSTKSSILKVLLYYYLKPNDNIQNVEIKYLLDDDHTKINISKTLDEIYTE